MWALFAGLLWHFHRSRFFDSNLEKHNLNLSDSDGDGVIILHNGDNAMAVMDTNNVQCMRTSLFLIFYLPPSAGMAKMVSR